MRSSIAGMAILVLAGAGVFSWQRSQNAALRAQIAEQGEALQNNQRRVEDLSLQLIAQNRKGVARAPRHLSASAVGLRPSDNDSAAAKADERRVIMDQYSDVLAQMNLSPATASRLQDLLTDRIEAVLDAQDSAREEGFADGSAETARAVALAVDEVDRDLATLVGPDGIRRLDGFPLMASSEPAGIPQQAAPASTVNVTVVVQAPVAPNYADSSSMPAVSDALQPYSPYLYLPVASFVTFPRPFRPFYNARAAVVRPHRQSERFVGR